MLARRWRTSGPFRLLILVVAVAAGGALVSFARPSTGSSDAERAAAADPAQLRSLHSEQARIRAAERRDPVLRRERARLREDQRAHFAHVPAAVARWPIASRAEQAAVGGALERSIRRGAVARWRAGTLNARARRTVCEHLVRPNRQNPPPPPLSAAEAGYECTAVTTFAPPSSRTKEAIIGFPFWARVNFRSA